MGRGGSGRAGGTHKGGYGHRGGDTRPQFFDGKGSIDHFKGDRTVGKGSDRFAKTGRSGEKGAGGYPRASDRGANAHTECGFSDGKGRGHHPRHKDMNHDRDAKGVCKGGYRTRTAFVDPLDIKFSQDSISPKFKDETLVGDTEAMLRMGAMRKRDVPMVRVTPQEDGNLWAHDHRRLHVYQQLRKSGDCGRIKVEITDQPVPAFKQSTRTEGNSIQVKPLPQNNVVCGWEYSAMPSSAYTYIGKDDNGEPMYLTDSVRHKSPTEYDLAYMTR